jgi:hypothetical protein
MSGTASPAKDMLSGIFGGAYFITGSVLFSLLSKEN